MVDYPSNEQRWTRHAAVWGLWLVLLALAFVVLYIIWMRAFFEIYYVWLSLGMASRLYYEVTIVGLTFPYVGLIVVGEPYLAAGARQQRLVRRFLNIAVPLLVAGVIGLILPLI